MSEDTSSSLLATQAKEPIRTTNTKNDDTTTTSNDHKKSSSPVDQNVHEEFNQKATSDTIKNNNSSTPEVETIPTNSTKTATNPIPDSSLDADATLAASNNRVNHPPIEAQSTTITETSTAHDHVTSTSYINKVPSESVKQQIPQVQSAETVKPSTSQNPKTVDQASSSKADNGTKEATNKKTSKDASEQERIYLVNLINQELKFVQKICPKLGEDEMHITEAAKEALKQYESLEKEKCDLKVLKDLKKTVTKLKLQIPAKYRRYDDSEQQKNERSDGKNKGKIRDDLLKNMPRLHNKLFQGSSFCKDVQRRFYDLKDEEFGRELKLCLLCFSVFPENELISRRLMVYWWIAEGLTPQENGKTAEDYANGFFEKIMEKDFIEPATLKSQSRYVAKCKMHPMVRAALVMIADQVKFFDFDKYGNPKDFGKFDEIESPEDVAKIAPLSDAREFFDFFDEQKQPTSEKINFGDGVQFAVYPPNEDLHDKDVPVVDHNGKIIDTNNSKYYYYRKKGITTRSYKVCLMGSGLSKGIKWEKLHMVFNVYDDILELKHEWFLRMKNVNVVFLGRWQSLPAHHIEVEEFNFEESLVNMNHVRFFSLQGVSRVSELPNSISKLGSLVILDLRACHNLEVIPKTIGLLKCLTHLDMSECYLLKDIPKEISTLESLQVLKGFVVVESPGPHECTLHDLRKLENLVKLSMYTHMRDFPQEQHLDALQKLEMLRKLTILWGGRESKPQNEESKPQNDESKQEEEKKKKNNISSRVKKLVRTKTWVQGSMRRMNAFNNSTLGSRLEKLDLKCFPHNVTPNWLTPGSLKGLKKLYIRGGQFSDLGQYQDTLELDDSRVPPKERWNNIEVLRLKYLDELKMEWRELQELFPNMTSLEKVKCPWLTLFPCDSRGLWSNKPSTTT
ncbi:uncharacterized protein [Rutidosis leptorrhynchoides]|uniref:uncharacterized protein n=1 Tax=Rutidosis leptorrhynchoides TaxID=125765 RepID=UPI003A9A07B9